MISHKNIAAHPWMTGFTCQVYDAGRKGCFDGRLLSANRLGYIEKRLLALLRHLLAVGIVEYRIAVGYFDLAPFGDDQRMRSVLAVLLIDQERLPGAEFSSTLHPVQVNECVLHALI